MDNCTHHWTVSSPCPRCQEKKIERIMAEARADADDAEKNRQALEGSLRTLELELAARPVATINIEGLPKAERAVTSIVGDRTSITIHFNNFTYIVLLAGEDRNGYPCIDVIEHEKAR